MWLIRVMELCDWASCVFRTLPQTFKNIFARHASQSCSSMASTMWLRNKSVNYWDLSTFALNSDEYKSNGMVHRLYSLTLTFSICSLLYNSLHGM
jgi:hypothetical protein